MRLSMQLGIGMELDGKKAPSSKLPPMIMTMDLAVKDVSKDGDIRYSFVLSKTDVPAEKGVDARVVDMLKKGLETLRGMKGEALVTKLGVTKKASILPPANADAATKQVMQGMEQALQQISVPLPEEAVGKGAKWRLTTPLRQNGVSLTQIADYELIKLTPSGALVKVKIQQKAPKQKVWSPVGVTVDLLSLASSGSGEMTVDLERLAPKASKLSLDSKVLMELPKKQKMRMSSQMTIAINP